ncbi:MAG: hypothetical protein J6S67_22015 [Methanobrevibacter sp.]|nr:hypothetical protein [Methanobrevibacter sp.]
MSNEIKFDKRNYRRHGDKNKQLIKKSLDELGAGRSIVIDNDGEIIGGNGVFEAWGNKPVKVIESDGSELVVVKRTDLSTNDEKRKKLAVMDNTTSDTSTFDMKLLKADFDIPTLDELGVELKIKDELGVEKPEVEFTEELLEEHNYVVLYFDNSVDWLQAQSLFDLKQVQALNSKEGFRKIGVGRVLKGNVALEKLRKHFSGE